MIVQRTAVKEPLTLDLAERTVERSGKRGRPRELRGSPQQREVAGELAIVFDQLERAPSPGILRSVLFDHGDTRFLVFFSSSESAFDAEVELFENVVLYSWEWTG